MEKLDRLLGNAFNLGMLLCIPFMMLIPIMGGVFSAILIMDMLKVKLDKYKNIQHSLPALVIMFHTGLWFLVIYLIESVK